MVYVQTWSTDLSSERQHGQLWHSLSCALRSLIKSNAQLESLVKNVYRTPALLTIVMKHGWSYKFRQYRQKAIKRWRGNREKMMTTANKEHTRSHFQSDAVICSELCCFSNPGYIKLHSVVTTGRQPQQTVVKLGAPQVPLIKWTASLFDSASRREISVRCQNVCLHQDALVASFCCFLKRERARPNSDKDVWRQSIQKKWSQNIILAPWGGGAAVLIINPPLAAGAWAPLKPLCSTTPPLCAVMLYS